VTRDDPDVTTAAGGDTVTITGNGRDRPLILPPLTETVPDSADPVDWAAQCEAHGYHQPVPRYLEHHHVIPQAWQLAWQPSGATGIWAPTTVKLCRTGHGNVHYWIERFMRRYNGAVHDAVAAALADQESVGRAEHVIARRALLEFTAAGGDLNMLVEHGLYGGMYGGNAAG
jgi:hypothetical protein